MMSHTSSVSVSVCADSCTLFWICSENIVSSRICVTGSDRVQVQTSSRDGVHCSCRHSGDRARGDGQLLRRVWLHPLPSLSRLDLVTWIHCVSVRILMTTSSKREQNGPSTTTETNANNGGFTQRVMLLSKSPCAMPCCAPFAVGIRGVIA